MTQRHSLRLELRVRNNVLWHAVFDVYLSVSEFCRASGLSQYKVGVWLNLKGSPYNLKDGTLTKLAQKACEVTGLGASELFPPDLYASKLPTTMVAELPLERLLPLMAAQHLTLPPAQEEAVEQAECGEALDAALATLTPREAMVVRGRFGLGDDDAKTLDEVGTMLNLGKSRVREVEQEALRKLRDPERSRVLRQCRG